jgi:hypothetical protein
MKRNTKYTYRKRIQFNNVWQNYSYPETASIANTFQNA